MASTIFKIFLVIFVDIPNLIVTQSNQLQSGMNIDNYIVASIFNKEYQDKLTIV